MPSSIIRGKYVVKRVIDKWSSEIVTDGAVFQDNGSIVEVGKYQDIRLKYDRAQVIGDGKQIVLPGLINSHHHVGLTPFQLGNIDLPLEPWIAIRLANRDVDNYLDTMYCALQMIENGITTVMHNHATWRKPSNQSFQESARDVLKAYQDSGMRVAFSFSHRDQNHVVYEDDNRFLSTLPKDLACKLSNRISNSKLSPDAYFTIFSDVSHAFSNDPKINVFLSPGNVQWCSDSLLEQIKLVAKKHNTGIHIHLQETIYQKLYGYKTWGKTPLAHLADIGFLGKELSCAHGVWLTKSDIDMIANSGTMVVHNASSNLRLKSGIAPINRMTDKGVIVAIGIDEAGLNDDKDMLQEMRLVSKIHREPGISSPYPTSHSVLHMATANGSKATFFDDIGVIEAGNRADIILVDLDHITNPYLDPDTNMIDALLYRGRGLDVNTTIVDGNVIMKDRTFTGVDKEQIWRELRKWLSKDLTQEELERKEVSRKLLPFVEEYYKKWDFISDDPLYFFNQG